MTLILDREGEREHPAVAVPQQVDPPESQGLPDALDFLDGSLDREERGPSRPFALADPELIVEDDPIAEGGEVREAREVSVRHPRAPVEAEDRAAIRRAERFPGQTVAEDGDLPLRHRPPPAPPPDRRPPGGLWRSPRGVFRRAASRIRRGFRRTPWRRRPPGGPPGSLASPHARCRGRGPSPPREDRGLSGTRRRPPA